jgi:hypothetical protein
MNVAAPRTGNTVSHERFGAMAQRGGRADNQWFGIEADGDQGRLSNLEIGRLLKMIEEFSVRIVRK